MVEMSWMIASSSISECLVELAFRTDIFILPMTSSLQCYYVTLYTNPIWQVQIRGLLPRLSEGGSFLGTESRPGGKELACRLLRYYAIPDPLDSLSLVPRCCQYRSTSRLWKRIHVHQGSMQAGLIGAAHLIPEVERENAAEFLMGYWREYNSRRDIYKTVIPLWVVLSESTVIYVQMIRQINASPNTEPCIKTYVRKIFHQKDTFTESL